jgi:hypothetical protein
MIKKLIAVLFFAVLAVSVAFALPASAAGTDMTNQQATDAGYEWSESAGGTITITYYDGSDYPVYIPGSIDGVPVTAIGALAFHQHPTISTVIIPDSVTSIGEAAFSSCSYLASVSIPNSVESIGYNAFSDCISLESITIPNSVRSIGDGAFFQCTSLQTVSNMSGVTSIEDHAFYGCTDLVSITIPSGVTAIGNNVFMNCESLTNLTIPSSVTSIGESAFSGCTNLVTAIPLTVQTIGSGAFSGCAALTNVTIPDGVTVINDYVFYDCYSLSTINIPDSVTAIGDYAFMACVSLTSITIPPSVTTIGTYVFLYSSLTTINLTANSPIFDDLYSQYPTLFENRSAVTYSDLYGCDNSANPTNYIHGTGVTNFTQISGRSGYTFNGWSPSTISQSSTGTVNITALWIENAEPEQPENLDPNQPNQPENDPNNPQPNAPNNPQPQPEPQPEPQPITGSSEILSVGDSDFAGVMPVPNSVPIIDHNAPRKFVSNGVTAILMPDGTVLAALNQNGTVNGNATAAAVRAAKMLGKGSITVTIPEGAIGISKSACAKIYKAARGTPVTLVFELAPEMVYKVKLTEETGQIVPADDFF